MNILTISKLHKEFSGELLFKNVSFEINSKDKIALIGKNGTGKSTLLKMIIQEEPIDSGDIFINQKAKIGYLSQTVISNKDHTLFEEMIAVFHDLVRLEEILKDVTRNLEKHPHDKEYMEQYERIEHTYSVNGGYEYRYKIDMILSKFGFDKEEYERSINTFSGGEKTRVAFAKLLLEEPDLLILDEPTNHLDINIIDWLEDYLNKYDGAVLIVTHDKYFISKVCRKIIEIDHNTSHTYFGTFEQYEEEKIKRYEVLLKQYNRQQKEIAHLQSFIDRFRYNSKRASLAKDRQKKIDRIDKMDRPSFSNRKVKMSFEDKRTTKEIILQAKNLTFGYETPLVSNMSFHMRGFDKLAIIGPNGTGKTTLLKVIEGKLKPIDGKIEFLRKYKIGYFDQNQETLHYHKTIFEEIHDYYPMFTNKDIRSVAARFLFFNEDLDKSISILSGGEKVRLVLLLLMLENPDLLILDEPTNHLDIDTKNIIEDVFNEFNGPIIFVSHDRYFINKIGTKIVHISKNDYQEFEGDYEAFKSQNDTSKITVHKKNNTKVKKRNIIKELKELEVLIHKLEQKLLKLETEAYSEEYATDYQKLQEINEHVETTRNELHEQELLYLELLDLHERSEEE
jgi:ATP-binding cassette subfamily F protein 3